MKEAEDSLRRLQVDTIDLYQLHWPDPLVPIDETAEALEQLLREGKVRALGLTNCALPEIKAFQEAVTIQAVQVPYNLFERAVEGDQLDYCRTHQIPVFGYGTLCRGLLTGAMKKNQSYRGDDLRSFDPKFKEPAFSGYLKCVESLQDWAAKKYHRSLIELAFRWVLDKEVIPLWGPQNSSELIDPSEFDGWKLTQEDFAEIDAIIECVIPKPLGIEFLAPPTRNN